LYYINTRNIMQTPWSYKIKTILMKHDSNKDFLLFSQSKRIRGCWHMFPFTCSPAITSTYSWTRCKNFPKVYHCIKQLCV